MPAALDLGVDVRELAAEVAQRLARKAPARGIDAGAVVGRVEEGGGRRLAAERSRYAL